MRGLPFAPLSPVPDSPPPSKELSRSKTIRSNFLTSTPSRRPNLHKVCARPIASALGCPLSFSPRIPLLLLLCELPAATALYTRRCLGSGFEISQTNAISQDPACLHHLTPVAKHLEPSEWLSNSRLLPSSLCLSAMVVPERCVISWSLDINRRCTRTGSASTTTLPPDVANDDFFILFSLASSLAIHALALTSR